MLCAVYVDTTHCVTLKTKCVDDAALKQHEEEEGEKKKHIGKHHVLLATALAPCVCRWRLRSALAGEPVCNVSKYERRRRSCEPNTFVARTWQSYVGVYVCWSGSTAYLEVLITISLNCLFQTRAERGPSVPHCATLANSNAHTISPNWSLPRVFAVCHHLRLAVDFSLYNPPLIVALYRHIFIAILHHLKCSVTH